MPETPRRRRSRRTKSARWIVFAIILCSGMSCLAPVLYASTDCSRWLAEYKQGILQRRAAHRLRAAKYRLVTMVHKPAPVHPHPMQHRLSPLESLRRFQIDCGDLEQPPPPLSAAVVPPAPLEPRLVPLSFPTEAPPELPAPTEPVLTAEVPPLIDVPVTPVVQNIPAPGTIPEPGSFVLVLSGAGLAAEMIRRQGKGRRELIAG